MTTYRVYIHTKKDTNEPFYIGRAVSKYRPLSDKSRNPHWRNVVAKHGFNTRVIVGPFTREYASKLEQRLIKLYSRKYRLTNMTKGGDGCLGFSHTEKAKQAMSKARKGVKHSAEWCNKISKAHKARFKAGALPGAAFYTEESRNKLRESGKLKRNKPNSKSKPVLCVTTGEQFVSCAHAANSYGANKDNLLKHLQERKYYNTIKGRIFKWL